MRRILIAIRVFFSTLFNGTVADAVRRVLDGGAPADSPVADKPATRPKKPATPKAARSEALTLLAALQREARFVDFVKEPLDEYSDEQIGAAARDVHRLCGEVLGRMFDLRPVLGDGEGSAVDVPSGFDAGKYRLTGSVSGEAPFRGQLAHAGWQAAKCDVPAWSGGKESALVVAPAEVEVKG